MKVAAAQIHPRFAKPEKNRRILGKYCSKAGQQAVELLVFPELCVSGYNFVSKEQAESLAEPVPEGETIQLWEAFAKQYGMIIVGGLVELGDDSQIYNSAALVTPDGFLGTYRKIHLFGKEKEWFIPGLQAPRVWKLPSVALGMLVCFDWIFPEATRILMLEGCEILCLPSNLILPYAQRVMVARSIENRIFTILTNRIGSERELTFTGRSQITNTTGEVLIRGVSNATSLLVVDIDPKKSHDKFLTATNNIIEDRRIDLYQRLLKK